jgi:major membrane immunogen (membrane-anchored lipoprotein)
MSEGEYNSRIEKIAEQIRKDEISLDEQDPKKLQRYYDFIKTNYNLEGESASQLVDVDPIKEGDHFGAGFS